ncbi:MAG: VanZ family protein [Bacillota bacterium]
MAETRPAVVERLWLGLGWLGLAIVLWGTLTPEPPKLPEPPIPQFDKLEHFTAFLLLTAWFSAAFTGRRRGLIIVCLFLVLGGVIELVQGWSGFRDAEWLDWAADCAGVAVGAWYPARWLAALRLRLIAV